MNKEQQRASYFSGFENMTIIFSCDALQWLQGPATDNNGETVSNAALFIDLLSRMRFTDGMSRDFRRPQPLLAGQAQYSEEQLAGRWNMGRKKVRNILRCHEPHRTDTDRPLRGGLHPLFPLRHRLEHSP